MWRSVKKPCSQRVRVGRLLLNTGRRIRIKRTPSTRGWTVNEIPSTPGRCNGGREPASEPTALSWQLNAAVSEQRSLYGSVLGSAAFTCGQAALGGGAPGARASAEPVDGGQRPRASRSTACAPSGAPHAGNVAPLWITGPGSHDNALSRATAGQAPGVHVQILPADVPDADATWGRTVGR
jgi:hypothetical protein